MDKLKGMLLALWQGAGGLAVVALFVALYFLLEGK